MATPPINFEAVPAAFDRNGTIGALENGAMVSILLFGTITVQTSIYYRSSPKDVSLLKSLVGVIWLSELGQTICVSHAVYLMTITQFGHPEDLVKPPTSLSTTIFFSGIVVLIVQVFFAYRVWVISGKLYIPVICWSLTFL